MNPLRWAVLVLCLDFAVALGLSVWLFTHQGYPHVVYYEKLRISTSLMPPGTTQPAELWVDPARNLERRVTGIGGARTTLYIEPGGVTDSAGSEGIFQSDSLTSGEWAGFVYDNAALRRGGFQALAASRLAHRRGPVVHVLLNGRPALRFETTQREESVDRLIVWLDARTHQPLQLRVISSGYDFTQTTIETKRIPVGALSAGFFDPPRPRPSPWDNVISWVHDHLMPGH